MTIAAIAIVIALPAWSLLALRRGPDAYSAAPPAVSYPAGTLVQPPRQVPTFQLIDEQGQPTSLGRLRGRWTVLAPAMTLCAETCPLTTAVLTSLTRALHRDGLARRVEVTEITVDPWRDTPARLRAYRRLTGADFTLLTGTTAEIRRLWGFLGVFYERVPEGSPPAIDWMTHRPETFDVQHTDAVFILDPSGRERVVDEGMPAPSGPLPRAVHALLDAEGRRDLADPQSPWSSGELLADLARLIGIHLRGAQASLERPRPPSTVSSPAAAASTPPAAVPPLRALEAIHAQGGRLLGGYAALLRRLGQLRGLPVVLNAWASWCPPCHAELPIFAAVSRRQGGRVAFLGVDVDDTASAARRLLAAAHIAYPSYEASLGALDALAPIEGTPSTIFLDRSGRVAYVHLGQYESREALERDLDRYALAG